MASYTYSVFLTGTNEHYLDFTINSTLNSSANSSDISWSAKYRVSGSGSYYSYNTGNRLLVQLNNTTYIDTSNICAIQLSGVGSKTIASGSFTILHNSDGTCSFPVYVYFDQTQRSGNDGTISETFTCDTNDINYTNAIYHWATGFKYGEGNNDGGNAFRLGYTEFTQQENTSFTLNESNATTIPNGFYLRNTFGTNNFTGAWQNFSMGSTFTQPSKPIGFEYCYDPIEYNITYNLNGGINHSDNESTYNVLYGITFEEPTRIGYTFKNWYIETEPKTIKIEAQDDNWNWKSILNNILPNMTYDVTIDSATIGNSTTTSNEFTALIYDFSGVGTLDSATVSLNNLNGKITFSLTCPDTANVTHDIQLIIYAGVAGGTSGKQAIFNNVKIGFADWNMDIASVNTLQPTDANKIVISDGKIFCKNTVSGNYFNQSKVQLFSNNNDYLLKIITKGIYETGEMSVEYTHELASGIYKFSIGANGSTSDSTCFSNPVELINGKTYIVSYNQISANQNEIILDNFTVTDCSSTGINVGDVNIFSNVDDLYRKLYSRMTGNVTLTAMWIAKPIQNIYIYNDGRIYAREFIESDEFYIDSTGDIYAPSFNIGELSLDENGVTAREFIGGLPVDI